MAVTYRIAGGIEIGLAGAPRQEVVDSPRVRRVALLGDDYPGLRPDLRVGEGDRVRPGEPLFADRHKSHVVFTAPAAGVVAEIIRGPRRRLVSVVVDCDGDATAEPVPGLPGDPETLGRDEIRGALLASGLWTAIRARPFGGVADPNAAPTAIFISAMDSNPLAVDPDPVIAAAAGDFAGGITALARLAECPVYVCARDGTDLPEPGIPGVVVAQFHGRHPAGLPGLHIHLLHPPPPGKVVWQIGYQDVLAIGRLLATGKASFERVVALCGPSVDRPRLVRVPLGASVDDVVADGLNQATARIVSGPVLSGHRAAGPRAFLGRYHSQIVALPEAVAGVGIPGRLFRRGGGVPASTASHGRATGFLPVESFQRALPYDIPAAVLLRALLAGDWETAAKLGCRGLIEEDLALCAYVCPGKQDYGAALRRALTELEAGI